MNTEVLAAPCMRTIGTGRLRRFAKAVVSHLRHRAKIRRDRTALRKLDERVLQDIGLSRMTRHVGPRDLRDWPWS